MTKRCIPACVLIFLVMAISWTAQAQDPCDNDVCCVNAATCVVTDKETLAAITVDEIIDVANCNIQLGTYVTGGNGLTGLAPANYPANLCGLSFSLTNETPAVALNDLDHRWLQSDTIPKVVDFGAPVNSVFVFVAVDHGPFPEEGIEQTVWGSDSPDISNFPQGWTLASLTTIWKKGWEDPVECQGQDNVDDFTGQYSFPGAGFRYVATHANFSISIFETPAHENWVTFEDNSGVPGWQSFDDEIDAIGAPVCPAGTVVADAGDDQIGTVGQDICFNGFNSTGTGLSFSWDLDGDGEIDASGEEVCIPCNDVSDGEVTLFVTENCDCSVAGSTCACVDSDTALYSCKGECGDGILDAGEQCDDGNNIDSDGCSATCQVEVVGGDGCTPGFWKQSQHFDSWTGPFTPDTLFSDVFEDAFPNMTLLEVAQQGGDGLNALGRHTVAALLNAASPDVSYDLSVNQVVELVNQVFPGTKSAYNALKDNFENFNEQGCPLN